MAVSTIGVSRNEKALGASRKEFSRAMRSTETPDLLSRNGKGVLMNPL
jgi:hypothetical protein